MIFDNSQLFFIILLFLWVIFVLEYLDNRKLMIALTQFFFMIPLVIILADISFNYVFGFAIVFIIPILSLWILVDGFYYRNENKRK